MSALFGTKYFGFIAGAYGVTAIVLVALIVWVLLTQRSRRAELTSLEQSGLRRAEQDG
ncbi:MAG: heme exporter protein CcmD [Rhizobiaceae bacterium]